MSDAASATSSISVRWFAAHEARLIWRDFRSLITGGRPRRTVVVVCIISAFVFFMHWGAAWVLKNALSDGLVFGKPLMFAVTGGLIMLLSLMFSQAIESVTRAYYARSDLELILSSPAPARKLFEVRTLVLTLQTIGLSVLIAAPMINVLIWFDGWHWVSAYFVLIAMGAVATASAMSLTLLLFRTIGAARTRLMAQIIAAVVGAGFIILLQAIAILFGQGISRFSFFTSSRTLEMAPGVDSLFWIPAHAVMGQPLALLTIISMAGVYFLFVLKVSAGRFAKDVVSTWAMVEKAKPAAAFKGFSKGASVRAVLRRKEWKLLVRDPWLISQSLQQILYLVPPALLLWINYGEGSGIFFVVVPVVVMAAGQLAGGLSWITISGEDAHELVETAPVALRTILGAKVQAVLTIIILLLTPFVLAVAVFSPWAAVCLLGGAALASGCAVVIQLWFRSQAKRSMFRRRQVSSKVATIAEAFVSILWAGGAALAMIHWMFALIALGLVAVVMGIAYAMRPPREQ